MRITGLDLENIKSYAGATIDFTHGINAICGMNGSGKTTILEAIGFALFDYLPYPHTAFLREGEKSGSMRVRILARDGREYEVVRRIGSNGGYYVADRETGTRLAERRENVLAWIASQALGIEGAVSLNALFKDAVGVPQGLMTADFLGTPVQRKAVFDPLLRVEEYRQAWEKLRETESHLRAVEATKREEIAGLEGQTIRIPEVKEQQTTLEEQRQQIETRLAGIAAELTEAREAKAVLDAVKEALGGLERDLMLKGADLDRLRTAVEDGERAVQSARDAAVALQASEAGYRRSLSAQERLTHLDKKRKQRDRLNQDLTVAQAARQGVFGRIQGLDAQINEAREAGEKAAQLVKAVERQDELERRELEIKAQLREVPTLEARIAKLRAEIDMLESGCTARERSLDASRAAVQEAAYLGEAHEELRAVGDRVAELKPLREELARVTEEGQRLRKQQELLVPGVHEAEDLRRQAEKLMQLAGGLESLNHRHDVLHEEQLRVTATLEYQRLARGELEMQHCPLLDLQCPVVSSQAGILDRFDRQVETLLARDGELQAELAAMMPGIQAAREADASLGEVRLKLAALEGRSDQVEALEEDLKRSRARYTELVGALAAEAELHDRQRELQGRVQELQGKAQLAAQLGPLQEQHERDRARLATQRDELGTLVERRRELAELEVQRQHLERELAGQGDPRSEQRRLLTLANRQGELETSLDEEQKLLAEEAVKVKALTANLQAFERLDAEIEEQNSIVRESRPDHERYIGSRDEAGKLAERERAVAASRLSLFEREREVVVLQRRLEEGRAGYDAERHAHLQVWCSDLDKDMSREGANHEHVMKALRVVEQELEALRRQQARLGTARAELEETERVGQAVKFIRETIKLAGPAVTENILFNISRSANDIFAEVMDDHAAELRWEPDYEVKVQKAAEERKFSQLSGGEQMSAALSVRLALLKEMSEIDFAFFDEPTQNMDVDRRSNLADQIRAVRGFDQLIVISHDDTFEHHTDTLIRLRKVHDTSELEAS